MTARRASAWQGPQRTQRAALAPNCRADQVLAPPDRRSLGDSILFPIRSGGRMTRSNVNQRLYLAVAHAGRTNSGLLDRPVTTHTVRSPTAKQLLPRQKQRR